MLDVLSPLGSDCLDTRLLGRLAAHCWSHALGRHLFVHVTHIMLLGAGSSMSCNLLACAGVARAHAHQYCPTVAQHSTCLCTSLALGIPEREMLAMMCSFACRLGSVEVHVHEQRQHTAASFKT